MVCPKCQSETLTAAPAEIRLYRNRPRTLSHPPLSPSPDVLLCRECGWAEFWIPQSWLAAGWLRQTEAMKTDVDLEERESNVVMLARKNSGQVAEQRRIDSRSRLLVGGSR